MSKREFVPAEKNMLADECILLTGDVDLWLVTIAGVDPRSPRAPYYVKWWDVSGKIATAKAAGNWPPKPANQWKY